MEKAIIYYDHVIKHSHIVKHGYRNAYVYKAIIHINSGNFEGAVDVFNNGDFDLLEIMSHNLDFEIWMRVFSHFAEKDKFFQNTVSKDCNNFDLYKDIYIRSLELMHILHVKELTRNDKRKQPEPAVAHYTEMKTAGKLMFNEKITEENGENVKKTSPMRLGSVATANDPQEGMTLLHCLGIENNNHKQSDFGAFITCFTFNHESLNQFRLYGKDNNKEATGVSLVVSKSYFENNLDKGVVSTGLSSFDNLFGDNIKSEYSLQDELYKSDKLPLFRCVYIDPRTHSVVSVGHREFYTFYREKEPWVIKDVKIYEKEIDGIVERFDRKFKELQEKIAKLNLYLKKKQDARYWYENERIETLGLEDKKKCDDKNIVRNNREQIQQDFIIAELLLHLRYLVKHVAFKEEQECRLIKVENLIENENIKVENNSRMFIEHCPINYFVRHIYFAPSTCGYKLFQDQIKREGLSCICELTDSPFRN